MNNPFKAPESKAGDEQMRRIHASRPPAVKFACQLLWVSIGLAALSLIPGIRSDFWSEDKSLLDALMDLDLALLMMLLEAWLIQMVYMQRNWARWTLLAFLAMGWTMQLGSLSESLAAGTVAFIIDSLVMILELAACYQLFVSPGRLWFRTSP